MKHRQAMQKGVLFCTPYVARLMCTATVSRVVCNILSAFHMPSGGSSTSRIDTVASLICKKHADLSTSVRFRHAWNLTNFSAEPKFLDRLDLRYTFPRIH